MKELHQLIVRPILTEKSEKMRDTNNAYAFEVHPDATKIEIKKAVERIFHVSVLQVNTSLIRGKNKRIGRFLGRRPNWKKAWVTLKEGDKIVFFEGV